MNASGYLRQDNHSISDPHISLYTYPIHSSGTQLAAIVDVFIAYFYIEYREYKNEWV